MSLIQDRKRVLYYRDLLIPGFWRALLRSLWLFFPPIIFILLAYFTFWYLVQGKDLMVIALQHTNSTLYVFACFILALVFWVYVTWYSTRLVAKAKDFQEPDNHFIWKIFVEQSPRILAFSCITIILLAFFQLDNPHYPQISFFWCHVLFLFSFSWYFLIFSFWTRFLQRKSKEKIAWLQFLERVRKITFSVLFTWILAVVLMKSFWGLITLLIGLQIGLVLLLILRREIVETRKDERQSPEERFKVKNVTSKSGLWKKIHHLVSDDEDKEYFRGFNVIGSLAFIVYIAAVFSIKAAVAIGSVPFMLLAFGVLLGIGNFIALVSVFARFNFHLLFFVVALCIGHFIDPHYATIEKKKHTEVLFSNREDLHDYFVDWINDSSRKKILDTTQHRYPVFFVMANGGASRSGYWVASVLSKLEDESAGLFSNHLFCLSGASGGSLGNAAFFSLLRGKEELLKKDTSASPFTNAAQHYLKSDFLTFTISHLLGPDIFRHFLPMLNYISKDRAAALSYALEKAPGESDFLYDSFAVRFSSFITQKGQSTYKLPILCINTTRMQDGSPAVISNILIHRDNDIISKNYFNNRIDVLGLLNENEDMKLSTAVVLGASFPYLSPAGRINSQLCDTCLSSIHYFVDGGYFDNSGAGVVNEMMIAMNGMLNDPKDSALNRYKDKLEFYVIHISNTAPKKRNMGQINPITNDLLAPIKTLIGSYGTQTSVNDQRLKSFLYSLYKDTTHYTNIDLYRNNTAIKYSMNWVISKYQLDSMNSELGRSIDFRLAMDKLKGWNH